MGHYDMGKYFKIALVLFIFQVQQKLIEIACVNVEILYAVQCE